MIQSLHIRNYAIIDQLDIQFADGLTIITGETGAGKSILLGALGLIMGERADLKSFFDADTKCVIEGNFLVKRYDLKAFFLEHELDYEDEVVVRREIAPSGKSRAFINDTPVNLTVLKQFSEAMIDLHQQFDTLDINELGFQLRLLDALAGNKETLHTYQIAYKQWKSVLNALEDLRKQDKEASKEQDFLQFQWEELSKATLQSDELPQLESELDQLTHAEDIKRITALGFHTLVEGDRSVSSILEDLERQIEQISDYHPRLQKTLEQFISIKLELEEIGNEWGDLAEEVEYDGNRIVEVQSRIDILYRLIKKHQVTTVEELMELEANIHQKLKSIGDVSGSIVKLEKESLKLESDLRTIAKQLNKKRTAVTTGFEQQVMEKLALLGMVHAQLKIDVQEAPQLMPQGMDQVQFLFAANKGSRLQAIKDVASGGELSRLTLVTKSLVASAIPLPSLIFDEIDAGVSGDVAQKMGGILRNLSDHHQVIVITHSPQVAAKADRHYYIYKEVIGDRTLTRVKALETQERIEIIATMLSQNPPSSSALQNAKELLML